MTTDDERAAFEHWLGEVPERDVFNDYADGFTSGQWHAWYARAQLAELQILKAMEK